MVLDTTIVRKAKADLNRTGGLSDAEIAEEAGVGGGIAGDLRLKSIIEQVHSPTAIYI